MLKKTSNIFKNKLTALIAVPLVFVILGYALIYYVASPIINPALSILKLIGTELNVQEDNTADLLDLSSLPQYSGKIKASTVTFPSYGDKYGVLEIEGTKVNTDLYFGDNGKILRKGAGQYAGSLFPGLSSTVLIGAHNNTYFNDLGSAKVGAKITLRTNYGVYVYEIYDVGVRKATDKSSYNLAATEENIVLYTCYPFNALGLTADRYFVWGKVVSGPLIETDK